MTASSFVQMWATAIATNTENDRVIIFRYAKDFSPDFNRASQPDRIIIVWEYESERGQPGKEEHRRMNIMEDALEPVLNDGNFATLVLVSTGEDLREWTYYARSEDEFIVRLNQALAGESAFPIEIHTASDPNWSAYEKFKAGVVE